MSHEVMTLLNPAPDHRRRPEPGQGWTPGLRAGPGRDCLPEQGDRVHPLEGGPLRLQLHRHHAQEERRLRGVPALHDPTGERVGLITSTVHKFFSLSSLDSTKDVRSQRNRTTITSAIADQPIFLPF